MTRTERGYKLSSGRELSAHRGILGLRPEDDVMYEGYDGIVSESEPENDWSDEPRLTQEERAEIADFMIARWQAWKDAK